MLAFAFKSVLWKSIALAAVGGLYGIVDVNIPFYAIYAEAPPPLLGNPFVYQIFSNCNTGPYAVCPPLVHNDLLLVAIDFLAFFSLCFAVAFLILYKLRFSSALKKGVLGRNSVTITIFVILLAVISLTAFGSVSQGASLVEPHWQTPSGVEVYPLNYTLYSGSATNSSDKGTAHLDIDLANYYWTPLNASFSISVGRGSSNNDITLNAVEVYQCPTPSSCRQVSSIMIPPYSSLNLTSSNNSLYLGMPIQKGALYSIQINMIANGIISQDTEVAQ
jgi:hypothetical protein